MELSKEELKQNPSWSTLKDTLLYNFNIDLDYIENEMRYKQAIEENIEIHWNPISINE